MKVQAEIIYPFPNFDGFTVEVWEWVSNFTHTVLDMWILIHGGIEVKQC